MTRLFVYGTLMRGEFHHDQLAGARFVGTGRTVGAFALFDMGGFPALVAPGNRSVPGELFDVDDAQLAVLDELEGHPDWYRRSLIALDNGQLAQTYLLPAEKAHGRTIIVGADWRAHARSVASPEKPARD